MAPSPVAAPAPDDVHHLLGHPTNWTGHIETHGPLNVALAPGSSWQESLTASLDASGLTGRGGGAFSAAIKLALARAGGPHEAIVVNGMESEPASDKDKLLLTLAPHLVLDGAQYLAALCGAVRIVVCVPTGRDAVADAVQAAIAERAQHRYIATREEVVRPPARFVAGEESALVNWVDSGNSRPLFRPNKSVQLRIGRRPALVHNAETLAHVTLIARRGPGPFRARGTSEEPGSCLVTIGGSVPFPGVVEVDRGTPVWDIVALSRPAVPVQALLVGGYGGTWIDTTAFGTPYASRPLHAIGASAGVGVIVVLAETACGVAETARIARYLADQSAGQCGPCTYGLPAIAADVALLARGRTDRELIPRLHSRLRQVDGRGACRHPDGAVSVVRSALTAFSADVMAHAQGEPCPYWNAPTSLRFPAMTGL